jgi:hypothetical protein
MGAASTYRIGPLSVFQDEAVVAHVTTGALPLALLQRRGSSSPIAMRRASPPSRLGTTSSSRAKPQYRDHLQPMPKLQRRLLSVAHRSAVPATPASSPSIRRSDLAMTKATGVIKGDRLTMALIALAVRGKRPRCRPVTPARSNATRIRPRA